MPASNQLLRNRIRPSVFRLAMWGAVFAGAYFVIEVARFTVWPIALGYADVVPAFLWRATLVLGLGYLVIGLMLGCLTGWALACLDPRRLSLSKGHSPPALAAVYLVVFYIANLARLSQPVHRFDLLFWSWIAASAALLSLVIRVLRRRRTSWTILFADPWSLALLLVLAPPVLERGSLIGVFGLGAIVGVTLLASRWLLSPATDSSLPWKQAAAVIAGCAIVLASMSVMSEDIELPPISSPATDGSGKPNVVMIVWDTVRADHLSLYGYHRATTPTLKEFADRSTVYTAAFSPSNYTLPAHASLFTGLYPRGHGALRFPPVTGSPLPLRNSVPTVAEILADEGYLTLAEVANTVFVRPGFGLAQGFQAFDLRSPAETEKDMSRNCLRHGLQDLLAHIGPSDLFGHRYRRADAVTDDALAMIEYASRSQRPFFLFVNFMDAHHPYVPPEPYAALFSDGRPAPVGAFDYYRISAEVIARNRPISEEEREHFVALYDGAIAYLDAQLRRLLDALRDHGLDESTLVIVTSDHGEAFGEHSHLGHAATLYQQQILVPLVIRYPGRIAPVRVDDPVSLVDVMPTVLDSLGLPPIDGLHGRSLVAAVEDKHRPVFAQENADSELRGYRPDYPARSWAVISDCRKLILASDGTGELYDLSHDPAEEKNLWLREQDSAEQLGAVLKRWLEQVPLNAEATRKADPKTLERLRQFGYVQ